MIDRGLTPHTKWIVCMWDIRGEAPIETAYLLKRSLKQVTEIIAQCKADGYYDKVKRHIDEFDCHNAKCALEDFAAVIKDFDETDSEELYYEQRQSN